MSTREQRLAKQRVAVSRNDHILAFGEVFETSLTFWNSFNVRFAILLTLCHTYCCTWPTVPKALATPTNSNAHVSPVGSKVMRCARGIHCEYVHLVSYRLFLICKVVDVVDHLFSSFHNYHTVNWCIYSYSAGKLSFPYS